MLLTGQVLACSDVFINQPKGHIEARTMDFGINIGNNDIFGYIGQKNTTDVVIDADKIPAAQLASWTLKYGYWGRGAFNSPKILEGMNTQGLTFSGLYLDTVTKYPVYNAADKRPVLGLYDIGSYILGTCRNVDEAVALIKRTQLVQSAVEYSPGVFLKDVPIHLSLRDASGKSIVVEFIDGKTNIYENAVNVLTNNPTYPEQLALAKKYDEVLAKSTKGMLTSMPGGYSSEDRFARGYIMTRSLAQPATHREALYQADIVINSLTRPYFDTTSNGSNSCTIWTVVKDLDNKVVYVKNNMFYQGGHEILPQNIESGYQMIDFGAINWNAAPADKAPATTKPTPKEKVLKVLSAGDLMGF